LIRFKLDPLETAAVISSLLYTLLLTYGSIWSWLFAAMASILFMVICFRKKIYAEWLLQLFYLLSAAYGYYNWGEDFQVLEPLALTVHLKIILGLAIGVILSGFLLLRYSDSKLPYLDSFTTLFSIAATLLMINFYPENWIYWIIIDAVSVYLYFRRGLKLSSLLFALYTLMAINGYLEWTGILS